MRRVLAFFAVVLLVMPAVAQSDAARERARPHFERGIELYDAGDFRGAIEAFAVAHRHAPYAVILYNIGLAHDRLGESLDAVRVMKRALAEGLKPEHQKRARAILDDHRQRIGQLEVQCNVDGVAVRINGEEIGVTPIRELVEVESGELSVSAWSDRHRPATRRIRVPPGGRQTVILELRTLETKLAQVKVHTELVDAEVWIDGERWGTTPLGSTVPLEPNQPHRIELRREGYLTAGETLTPLPGTTHELTLAPRPDRAALRSARAELRVTVVPSDSTVHVDGELRAGGAWWVAPGRHVIEVEREGYFAVSREVTARPNATTTATIALPPTPHTRAELIADAERVRRVAWGLGIGGVVALAAGIPALAWGVPARQRAEEEIVRVDADPVCTQQREGPDCRNAQEAARQDRNIAEGALIGGGIAIGVGAAALTTGIVLLLTGDDPDDFVVELPDELARLRPIVGPGALGVAGSY